MPDLSVQLYTVRDALAENYDETLAALAGFGFTAVEPFRARRFRRRNCGAGCPPTDSRRRPRTSAC